MQAVDGEDGARAADSGWPAFHRSTVHASPLAYDLDFDGVLDVLVATYDGDILAVRDTARPRAGPALRPPGGEAQAT
jgi:hypothetical protein